MVITQTYGRYRTAYFAENAEIDVTNNCKAMLYRVIGDGTKAGSLPPLNATQTGYA